MVLYKITHSSDDLRRSPGEYGYHNAGGWVSITWLTMQTLPYHIRGSCIKADIQDKNPCLRTHPYSAKEWSAYSSSPAERAREKHWEKWGVTVGGGLEKLSQGRNFFFWFRPRLNFLHMLTMSSKLFQPRLSFLHMLIMSWRINII